MNLIQSLSIIFIFVGGLIIGLTVGLNVPEEIKFIVDTGENYNNVVGAIKDIQTERYAHCQNITFNCEYQLNKSFYNEIVNLDNDNKLKNSKLITFCKLPHKASTLFINKSREVYLLELNKEIKIKGHYFEIIGGNWERKFLVLSIDGKRYSLKEGDHITDRNLSVVLDKSFVTNIPVLDASGTFEIYTEPKTI